MLISFKQQQKHKHTSFQNFGWHCFRRLDYDKIPGHFYELTVFATDKGIIPKSSSVNIRVTVLNVNDEAPEFTSTTSIISVDENAPVGTVIAIVQAVDLDGDAISYFFSRKLLHSYHFYMLCLFFFSYKFFMAEIFP